jgi:hypothetical protein
MTIEVDVELVTKTAFADGDGYFLTAAAHGHSVRIPLTYEAVKKLAESIDEATSAGYDIFGSPRLTLTEGPRRLYPRAEDR